MPLRMLVLRDDGVRSLRSARCPQTRLPGELLAGGVTMTEEEVRKAWSMVRRAAERLAQATVKLEAGATGDGVQDASLLSEQRSARDLLDVHLRTVDLHYEAALMNPLTHRAEDNVED